MSDSSEGRITLIPSVHVSANRIEAVRQELTELEPDLIGVELDATRFSSMTSKKESRRLLSVVGEMGLAAGVAYLSMGLLQVGLSKLTGVKNGSDMATAISVARDAEKPIALVDMDIQPVFHDIVGHVLETPVDSVISFFTVYRDEDIDVDLSSFRSFLGSSTVDMDEIDELISIFREVAPYATQKLIDERNEYMAVRLWRLKQEGVHVAVVLGAGHVSGIAEILERYEEQPPEVEDIDVPIRYPVEATEEN